MFGKIIKKIGNSIMNVSSVNASNITVNGKTFSNISGNNVSIVGGKVIVDGVELEGGDFSDAKIINVTINGDCGDVKTSQGDINCGNCSSAKSSQGNIDVSGDVKGDVKTSQGNIKIKGSVAGSVKTNMGNITHG